MLGRTETRLARFEVGTGVILFVYGTLSPMIGRFYPALEPDTLYGFWPMLVILTGGLFVAAGAGIFRGSRWRYLMQIPLGLWLAYALFYFFIA